MNRAFDAYERAVTAAHAGDWLDVAAVVVTLGLCLGVLWL